MRTVSKTLFSKAIFVSVISLLLASCSSQFAASMRKVTYPPDFKYTEPSELKTDMGRLSHQMHLLDIALLEEVNGGEKNEEAVRQQVLTALQNMSKIAATLQAGKSGGNHPYLQNYMQDFVAKVDEAKIAASLAQPRYYLAGKVSGSCTSCHKVNR